ncbi:MAG: hypothetical protein AAGG68_08065 [Bacteroidota bacterium]
MKKLLLYNRLSKANYKKMEVLKQKSFSDCTLDFLDTHFGLRQVENLDSLNQWLSSSANEEIPELKVRFLEELQALLQYNVRSWNEQELDMHFIGPVFSIVNFSSEKFNLFAQRPIEAIVEEWRLFGTPDGMVASGRRAPKLPFFAFSEYKRQKNPKGEPEAQTLAAMMVGQHLNSNSNLPVYGCYVIGNDWYFMTLEEKKYAFSRDFSAITDDLFSIFRILNYLKQIISQRLSKD